MEPHRIELIRASWNNILPIKEQAAAMFYQRLFELDPSLKPMFKGDIKEQGDKLMKTLTVAISSLTQLDILLPILQDMARRHVDYGVKDEHYALVGQALIDTLATAFGDDFNEELKSAWVEMYQTVADAMIAATK
ncbi:MAG: globin family protein [Parashewanella sp.]